MEEKLTDGVQHEGVDDGGLEVWVQNHWGVWEGGSKPVTTTLTYCNIREKRLGCCRSSPSGRTAGRKRATGKTKPRQRRRGFSFFPRLFKSRTFSLEPRDKEPKPNSFSVKSTAEKEIPTHHEPQSLLTQNKTSSASARCEDENLSGTPR